jgi:dsDNA-specific endonuclease/ATPase MutS2
MQTQQIRQKFSNIEQCVDNAARACQQSGAVPEQLRHCLDQLESQSDQAKQMMQAAETDERLRQCVDRMEELGDRAMQECRSASGVDRPVQEAIRQAHDAISDLKRNLH